MPNKHPYTSGSGTLVRAVQQLRKAFPAIVTAETLKKLGIAPNNESYVINILRFVNVIDEEGKKTKEAAPAFSKHGDDEFQSAFADLVKSAYGDLFSLHGEDTWSLDQDQLISYFRTADESSDVVGRRQAGTFQTLSALAGKTELPKKRKAAEANGETSRKKSKKPQQGKEQPATVEDRSPRTAHSQKHRDLGLTVRIEINLPASGDQDTYDRIFRSIRENLIDVE